MNEKVKRVMEYIHGIAYRELQGDQYIEFLECIEYEIDKELDEGDWPEPEEDLSLIHISEPTRPY